MDYIIAPNIVKLCIMLFLTLASRRVVLQVLPTKKGQKSYNYYVFFVGCMITGVIVVFIWMINSTTYAWKSKTIKDEYKDSWHYSYMELLKIHDKAGFAEDKKIGIIDTGLSEKTKLTEEVTSFNVTKSSEFDTNGHGSMMYSIIKGYNDEFIGIAPEADIISIKAMDKDDSIEVSTVIEAIDLAVKNDCDIINLSLGSYIINDELLNTIDGYSDDVLFIVSSGDDSSSETILPANMDNVISVGAIDSDLKVAEFTNMPSDTDINAPGVDILTVDNKQEKTYSSGTSQATAIVTGYVALLMDTAEEKGVELTYDEIRQILNDINSNNTTYYEAIKNIK